VFSRDAYVSLDYQKRYGIVARRSGNLDAIRSAAAKIRAGEIQDLSELNFADIVHIEELQIDDIDPCAQSWNRSSMPSATARRPRCRWRMGLPPSKPRRGSSRRSRRKMLG